MITKYPIAPEANSLYSLKEMSDALIPKEPSKVAQKINKNK